MAGDGDDRPEVTDKPKKRKYHGRKWEISKKLRLSSHTTGAPCNCKRLQCFEIVSAGNRERILNHFNSLATKDEQDSLLASFITVNKVKQRRPRNTESDAKLHDYSYTYKLRIIKEGPESTTELVQICVNAFTSIFGITTSRVERIRTCLATSGK